MFSSRMANAKRWSPGRSRLRLAERYAGDDVRVTLLKDAEHRLSRPQDLACLTDLVGDLL